MLDRYGGGDEKSETLAMAEGSLSNSDNESSDDEDEEHEQSDDDDIDHRHHHRRKVSGAATDSGASELEEEVEERANGHASIMRAAERDMTTRNSKSNQSNGVDGSGSGILVEQQDGDRDHSPIGTDNEIVDEAEVKESEEEEQEEEEENETGNNTV